MADRIPRPRSPSSGRLPSPQLEEASSSSRPRPSSGLGAAVAKKLLENVFLDMAMFPTILRSDKGKAFTSTMVAYMNSQLEVRHVMGSTYHPQSQGLVERLHRTMKIVVTGLLEDSTEEWPALLPYAQFVLRTMPLKSLGGRSPYEVVTGLKQKLPVATLAQHPVQEITVDAYVE